LQGDSDCQTLSYIRQSRMEKVKHDLYTLWMLEYETLGLEEKIAENKETISTLHNELFTKVIMLV